jgi:hypothetical protein
VALELHRGRSWREHDDADVGIVRQDLPALYGRLSSWDLHVAAGGVLSPWRGERLQADEHQNNIWCRLAVREPWLLDVTVGDGSSEHWIYRRDPTLQVPWELAVLRTPDGIPYLSPELLLIFKSKSKRPKDDLDAEEVIPALDEQQRDFLRRRLDLADPWRRLLQ